MDEGDEQTENEPNLPAKIAAVVVLLALVVGAVFVVIGIVPHKVHEPKNPSFVDNIFASSVVLVFVRIALLFAAGYVVISVVGLILGRRWIAEMGPFKASEPIARLERGAEALQQDLADALETVEGLESQLVENGVALAQSQLDIEFLLDQIDTMEAQKEGK